MTFFCHIRKKKNYLKFSLSYGNTDGHRSNYETPPACPFTLLSQLRIRLSTLAHRWYSNPQLFSLDKRICSKPRIGITDADLSDSHLLSLDRSFRGACTSCWFQTTRENAADTHRYNPTRLARRRLTLVGPPEPSMLCAWCHFLPPESSAL